MNQRIHKVVVGTQETEERIRKWCEKKLITPNGTRALVYLTGISSEDEVDSSVIVSLESNHLIREVWLSGARWYELTHDRLIGPIKDSNKEWLDEREQERLMSFSEANERIRNKYSRLKIIIPIIVAVSVIAVAIAIGYTLTHQPNNLTHYTPKPLSRPLIVRVGKAPTGIAVNPNNNMAYAINTKDNSVPVIDTTDGNLTRSLSVGKIPSGVAVNPNTNLVYTANQGSNTVSVINGKRIVY